MNDTCSKYIGEANENEVESKLLESSEASLRIENETLLGQLERAKENTIELEASLAQKIESENAKAKAAQEAEQRANLLELKVIEVTAELKTLEGSMDVLNSRSSALEKVGEEADAEIISLLRRAQEAESWQATIREGFARIIEVHSDEPFEQTWQKLEEILQSSITQSLIACDASCAEPQDMNTTEATGNANFTSALKEANDDCFFKTEQFKKGACQTAGNTQTAATLAPRIGSPSKALKFGDCIESLPKFPPGFGHIVPFSSVHERLSREDSLSLFNDPAELEMLFMSTPDLQGGQVPGDTSKGIQEPRKPPVETQAISRELNEVVPTLGAHEAKSERPAAALENTEDPLNDESVSLEQPSTKRKVVSFEGTRVFTQTEVGRARRMSDATDNSSGRESESRGVKKTQKRTYSRLRQSVAQEETSIETSTELEPANNSAVENSQPGLNNTANLSSSAKPRPRKRPRNASHDPERRLSPKGLASGSSRSNATGQAHTMRGRGKRRTRGMINDAYR